MSRHPKPAVPSAAPRKKPHNPNLGAAPRAVAIPLPALTDYMRKQVKAAGGDPSSVPDEPYRLIRPTEAAAKIGVCVATLYRMIEDGTLPRPIPVDRASARAAAAP